MNDILDLAGWTVLGKRLDGFEYELEAEYTVQPTACQKCGVIGRLYKHGTKPTTYRDSPIRGHAVRILAKVQRFKCRECGETFLQPLAGMHSSMRMTERCANFIKGQSLMTTFVRVAEAVGCDEKTVRSLAGDHIAELEGAHEPRLPEWLGIDETQIDGKMRCVITDIGGRRPIEMLADRDKGTLTTWLHSFKERAHVKGVAIDMWRPYRDVARVIFPNVPVVIDKFHVVRMANYCMERVRIRLGKSQSKGERRVWMRSRALINKRPDNLTEKQRLGLSMWLENDPEMAAAYQAKEAFYAIYDMPKADAELAYDAYAASLAPTIKADFKVLLTAMKNWRPEILAYFDHPISNAYTEALNGVAKQVNRAGRGYSFEVLRARVLFKDLASAMALPSHSHPVFHGEPVDPDDESLWPQCQSCWGIFPNDQFIVDEMPAIVPGEHHRKMALLCHDCMGRFHTDWVKPHDSTSTH